jgi:predicted nucleic acid-binding protein
VYSALLDACVLHPWALCQLQLLIAEHGLFRPVWSGQILEETKRSILRVHPEIEEARISKRIAAMRFAFEDAEVSEAQVRARLAAVPESVPDHDRHVVAAALAGRADVIVTANIRHFSGPDLAELGILVEAPDDFLIDQWYLSAPAVADALVVMALQTKRPALSPDAVLALLERSVPSFVAIVRGSPEWVDASAGLEQSEEVDRAK